MAIQRITRLEAQAVPGAQAREFETVRRTGSQDGFGEGDDLLEAVLVRRLTERKQTLALAESCTGG